MYVKPFHNVGWIKFKPFKIKVHSADKEKERLWAFNMVDTLRVPSKEL